MGPPLHTGNHAAGLPSTPIIAHTRPNCQKRRGAARPTNWPRSGPEPIF